jgi:hypothetical protein
MKKSFELKKKKDLVFVYLNEFEDTRTSGNMLLKRIWTDEAVKFGMNKDDVEQFLDLLLNNRLSNPTTILRSRNLILKDYPEWRGEQDPEELYNYFKKELLDL